MTKHSPTRATEAYIFIVGHITIGELQRRLDETAMANGFANLFCSAASGEHGFCRTAAISRPTNASGSADAPRRR